jgi:hypothetical protein
MMLREKAEKAPRKAWSVFREQGIEFLVGLNEL